MVSAARAYPHTAVYVGFEGDAYAMSILMWPRREHTHSVSLDGDKSIRMLAIWVDWAGGGLRGWKCTHVLVLRGGEHGGHALQTSPHRCIGSTRFVVFCAT